MNKKEYKKGDLIKGRIPFECAFEMRDVHGNEVPSEVAKVEGVFKTTVE